MKNITKITRITTKRFFNELRKKSPIFCNELNSQIKITKLFFDHINWSSKNRGIKDVIIRLLTISLIEEILKKWKLSEIRENSFYKYHEIQFIIEWEIFCLILSETKKNWIITLLSSFVIFQNKKSSSQDVSSSSSKASELIY